MHNERFAGCLLCLALLVGLGSGCQVFRNDRTLAVLVRDAETKKPVATAEVYLCQRVTREEVAPCRAKGGFTQADGIAQLHAEPSGEFGLQVQAVAQGYLPEKVNVSAELVNGRRQPAGPSRQPADAGRSPDKPRSPDVVVEMYSAPAFAVELVLPANYRGLVKAEVQFLDNLPLAAGQRCFQFLVPPSGEVQVRGPSLLRQVQVADFRARYANGPVLGTRMDVDKIGFRWLKGAGNQHYFVAGTQMDYEKLHAQYAPEDTQKGSGSWDETAQSGRKHKYRYGKMTGKNYEPDN